MPEIKIKSEVAGRVCSIAAAVGASLSDGDEIANFGKPLTCDSNSATASVAVKSICVAADGMVAEGRVIAVMGGV